MAGEQEIAALLLYRFEIIIDGLSGLLGYLELNGSSRLPLSYRCAIIGTPVRGNIFDLEAYNIATTQLTIDGEIEEGEVSLALGQLQPGSYCPDMSCLKRWFGAGEFAFVPRVVRLRRCGLIV